MTFYLKKLFVLLSNFKEKIISPFLTAFIPLNLFNMYIYNLNIMFFILILIFLLIFNIVCKKYYPQYFKFYIQFHGYTFSSIIFFIICYGFLNGLDFREIILSTGLFPEI